MLPRALGLPRDPAAAATRLAAGRTRRIGLGRANGRRFGFNAGVGFDAELVRRDRRLGRSGDGRRPGDLAFARAALGLIAAARGRFEPVLELDGVGRAAFVLVANCAPYTYLGRVGLAVAPEASFDAGLDPSRPSGSRLVPAALRLTVRGAAPGGGLLVAHDSRPAGSAATAAAAPGGRRGPRRRRDRGVRGRARRRHAPSSPRGRKGSGRAGDGQSSEPTRVKHSSRVRRRQTRGARTGARLRRARRPGGAPDRLRRTRLEHPEVLVQHPLELVAVAPSHRGELAAVDVERRRVVVDAAGVGVADRRQRPAENAHRGLDRRVVARADHARGGTWRRRASRSPARRDDARAGRSCARARRSRSAWPVRIASSATARSSTRRARSTSIAAPSSSATAVDEGDRRHEVADHDDAAALAAAHRRRARELEHAERLAQGRLRDSERAASSASLGSRSPRRRRARSIASVRCSIAASNVRVARTGSIVNGCSTAVTRRVCHPRGFDSKRETLFHFKCRDAPSQRSRAGSAPRDRRRRGRPDGEHERLVDDDAAALHRSLVLLRTYDERSVVYHRQGRIGTYAIFWGHEAIQAGAMHALEERDWVFPSYRESAIGLLRGMPAATILSWWRGHPAGLVEPCGAPRRVASASRSPPTYRTRRARLGAAPEGSGHGRGRPSSGTAPRPRARFTRAPTSPR